MNALPVLVGIVIMEVLLPNGAHLTDRDVAGFKGDVISCTVTRNGYSKEANSPSVYTSTPSSLFKEEKFDDAGNYTEHKLYESDK